MRTAKECGCCNGSIEPCLRALRNEGGWERIVVDNASQDDTLARAERADPGARLVRNTENSCFAGVLIAVRSLHPVEFSCY